MRFCVGTEFRYCVDDNNDESKPKPRVLEFARSLQQPLLGIQPQGKTR